MALQQLHCVARIMHQCDVFLKEKNVICDVFDIFMPLDRGKFVVVHPCSTFSDCCRLATLLNAELQRNGNNWGFSAT